MDRQSYEMSLLNIFREYTNTARKPRKFFKNSSMAVSSLSDMEENLMVASFPWQPIRINFHIVPDLKTKKKDTGFVSGW